MKLLNARSIGILLATFLFATGCVSVVTTTVGGAVKGAKVGTKAAVSTAGATVKATGAIVGGDKKDSEPDSD